MATTETREASATERILAEMLTENTGRHMLDSGGAYGRSWERNRAAVEGSGSDAVDYFRARPVAQWHRDFVSLDVFHWLSERVEYDARLDRAWRTWCELTPASGYGADVRYYNAPSTFEEWHSQLIAKGYADDGRDFGGMIVNTYNGEDALSQTLQYGLVYLTEEGAEALADSGEGYYVLLSIHGGCDVRGGYTDLRAFWLGDYEGVCDLLDNAKLEAWCDQCGYSASSDNAGYEWQSYDRDTGEESYSGSGYFGREDEEGYAEKRAQYLSVAPVVDPWHWHGIRSEPGCPKCRVGTVQFSGGWVS